MREMGKFDLAEKYYRRLLNELPSNDPSLSLVYHRLGMVAAAQGEYEISLRWYEKSLEIDVRTRPSDYVNIGLTHNSIGEVHRKKADLDPALESYNRAVSLFEQAHDNNRPYMAHFTTTLALSIDNKKSMLKHLTSMRSHLLLRGSICHPIILIWVDRTTILALFIDVSVIVMLHWNITIDHLKLD